MNVVDANSYIDQLRNEYVKTHIQQQERDLLIEANNVEKRDVKGYHGREILELLQNADDAYQKSIDNGEKPDCDLKVFIKYVDNVLTVTNTGTFFDKDGIKAIVQGNNSPKVGRYIGNKGTGFRSVLNWSEKVRIMSGDFAVEFSKEIARQILDSIRDHPQIRKQIEKHPNLYIPMLAVPQNVEHSGNPDITTIEIEIDPEKTNDDFSVLKQLDNLDLRILLFLPNISQIHIVTEETDVIYKRQLTEDEWKMISLQKIVSDSAEVEEKFYVFDKIIPKALKEDQEDKDILLSIAVPEDYSTFHSTNLYSFFPLFDTESPFDCVMHASYFLNDHRNTLTPNEGNKTIIKCQLEFLIDVAKQFLQKGKCEHAYKMIVPISFSDSDYYGYSLSLFSKFKLEDYYLDSLSKQNILQTINGKLISILDNPKIINGGFPDVFKGKEFDNLLIPIDDKRMISFLKYIAGKKHIVLEYDEKELCALINLKTDSWSISDRVDVFIWWNSFWKNKLYLPNLLLTRKGTWLVLNGPCYFLIGNFDSMTIPSWVDVPALDEDYQKALFAKAEESPEIRKIREIEKEAEPQISRMICQNKVYSYVDFKYRDRNSVISAVNASVDNYDKAVNFVKWLWENYKNEKQTWVPPVNTYNFPSEEGGFKDCKKLYFGDSYNNPLAKLLFDDTHSAFPSPETFSIDNSDLSFFKEFVREFGVKDFPEIIVQEIEDPFESYKEKYEEIVLKTGNIGKSSRVICSFSLPYINNFEKLLQELSTRTIIEWMLKDTALYTCITNKSSEKAMIRYRGNSQWNFRKYEGTIDNYILEVLNEKEWIEIKGKRFAPNNVLQGFMQGFNAKNNNKFKDLAPVLTMELIESFAKDLNVEVDRIRQIMENFRFCEKITDLDSDLFYGIMLGLPKIECHISVELSKSIFRIIEQASFNKTFDDSDNKRRFFKGGQVLVKYHGKLQYFVAKDAFLPSSKIIVKEEIPIVEKGQRTNNANFVRLFGCKEYDKDYSVVKDNISKSPCDGCFQKYFVEFQKYAIAFADNNENIGKYGINLCVTLVDRIFIRENDVNRQIEEEYILIRDTMTNWYVTVFSPRFNINTISEIIETIYSNIANTPGFDAGKIGELFRAKEKEDRDFLIKKEFGSLSVIDDDLYSNNIKNNFVETINNIVGDYDIDEFGIDFVQFDSISNMPKIINIFQAIGTDVDEFKTKGFVYKIDLVPYYRKQLRDFIQREKRRFKDYLFSKAKDDESLQGKFIKTVECFERYEIDSYRNSVGFDVEQVVLERFGSWNNDVQLVSAEEEYSNNYDRMNPNKIFEDEIANNLEVRTMIYFGKIAAFEKWLEIMQAQHLSKESDRFEEDVYGQFRNVLPNEIGITYHSTEVANDGKKGYNVRGGKGTVTKIKIERRQHHQKILGNKGELLVYNLLCDKVGRNKVFPRSEAFVELGILKPGQAISGEYDLSYKDENEKEYYVEVKTGDGKSFFISPEELQFAKDNADNYKLILVYNLNDEKPCCSEIPMRFWEDERFKIKEIIERIEFEF